LLKASANMTLDAVLLDLDGTLIDTAPDMVAALNRLLQEQSAPPVPYGVARNQVSNGAAGLLRLGLGIQASENAALRQRYLDIYAENICINSRFFNGLETFFNLISRMNLPWGIVTNKPGWLTEPLLAQLRPQPQPGCVVSGDAIPERKPHPAPLLLAAQLLGVAPENCLYVGDARRDIQAGLAAGMRTATASYGYIVPQENLDVWQADFILKRPEHLARCISAL
jgi:2-phosphoglycolate phosphatase